MQSRYELLQAAEDFRKTTEEAGKRLERVAELTRKLKALASTKTISVLIPGTNILELSSTEHAEDFADMLFKMDALLQSRLRAELANPKE